MCRGSYSAATAGRSSNGRTPDSGSGYPGSNPGLPANYLVESAQFDCANPLHTWATTWATPSLLGPLLSRRPASPLVPVASEEQATYVLKGTSEEKKPGAAKIIFMGQLHSDNAASVQMADRATGAIVFAYAVNKKNTLHGQQTTAEACAKHLKEQIEKK